MTSALRKTSTTSDPGTSLPAPPVPPTPSLPPSPPAPPMSKSAQIRHLLTTTNMTPYKVAKHLGILPQQAYNIRRAMELAAQKASKRKALQALPPQTLQLQPGEKK